MPIRFRCSNCSRKIQVRDVYAGKKTACPDCKAEIVIPLISDASMLSGGPDADVASPATLNASGGPMQAEAQDERNSNPPVLALEPRRNPGGSGRVAAVTNSPEAARSPAGSGRVAAVALAPAQSYITFACPNCQKMAGFPGNLAGTPAACPMCHVQLMIPAKTGDPSFVLGAPEPAAAAPVAAVAAGAPAAFRPKETATFLPGNAAPRQRDSKPFIAPAHSGRARTERAERAERPERAAPPPAKSNLKMTGIIAGMIGAVFIGVLIYATRKNPDATATAPGAAPDSAGRPALSGSGADTKKPEAAIVKTSAANTGAESGARTAAQAQNDSPSKAAPDDKQKVPAAPEKGASSPLDDALNALGKPKGAEDAPPSAAPTPPSAAPAPPAQDPPTTEPGAAPSPVPIPPLPERRNNKGKVDDEDEQKAADDLKKKGERAKDPAAPNGTEPGVFDPFKKDEPKAGPKGKEGDTPAKPGVKPQAGAEPAKVVPAAPPVCPVCYGTTYVPFLPGKPYIWMEKEVANPQAAIPWRPCPRCQPKPDANALLQAETDRLGNHLLRHQQLSQAAKVELVHAETQHVTLHAQLPSAQTRLVAKALEDLKVHLEKLTATTVLTPTRPDKHEILILKDVRSYSAYIDFLAAQNPGTDFTLTRKSSGSTGRNMCFFNANIGGMQRSPPPEHGALFELGHMLMWETTDNKAPIWLVEGFAAYCENSVMKKNLWYSFAYELNELKFTDNWNDDIKKFAKANKLRPWKEIFPIDLIGVKSVQYLTCYSMVSFLMTDPPKFVKFVLEIKAGADSATALERAYGQKVENLQAMWANWTLSLK